MTPYWLKPNRVGIAFLAIFAMLILFLFVFFDIIPPNQPLYLCWAISVLVAYPISMILGIKVGKKMKILLGVVLGVLLSLFAYSACPILSGRANIGLPFGYYGQHNRVKNKLRSISNVNIVGGYCHRDMSLEDFGFVVQTKSGLHAMLDFSNYREAAGLFTQAEGMLVQSKPSTKGLVYKFGHGEKLEQTIDQKIRNATDAMKNFDRIAEVIETDRANGASEQNMGTEGKKLLWITFPVSQKILETLKL